MTGFNYEKKPFHTHDCDKCKFLFAVQGSESPDDKIDFYESCQKDLPGHDEFIIRFSSEGSDYATVNLKILATSYAIRHDVSWKVNYS